MKKDKGLGLLGFALNYFTHLHCSHGQLTECLEHAYFYTAGRTQSQEQMTDEQLVNTTLLIIMNRKKLNLRIPTVQDRHCQGPLVEVLGH